MATFIDNFDGAAGTLLSSRTGWANGFGYYDLWQLDGSGAASHPAYSDDGKQALHDTGSLSHYVKVVLGTGFLGSARGCGIILGGGVASGALTVEDSGGDLYLFYKGGSVQNLGSGWAAGDELEVAWNAATKLVTVRRNGTQVGADVDLSGQTWTDNGSSAGFELAYSGQPARADLFRSFEAGPLAPPDTTPPTLTGTITLGARTASSIETSCPAATDDVAVTAYDVRIDGGAWIDKGLATSHNFTGLTADTAHTIDWTARDAAGNRSTPPLSVSTSTYPLGAMASTILLITGPQEGNPAGMLYALAGTVQPGDWLSYYIVSGPTPAGGVLDAQANGAFTYTGPAPATLVIQPKVNGVDVAQITVTLYDATGSLSGNNFAVTPAFASGGIAQAAPVPLTGVSLAVIAAFASGAIAQAAPVPLSGARLGVTPAFASGSIVQGAAIALSGVRFSATPAYASGALVQAAPVLLSGAGFVVVPAIAGGAIVQSASIALQAASFAVTPALAAGSIVEVVQPNFTSMASSPVYAVYLRDSYRVHAFHKAAGEVLDFDIDYSYELRATQDSPRAADPVEVEVGAGVDVLGAYWVPGLRRIKLWLSGGVQGGVVNLSVWLNTTAGRRLQADVRVYIK